ncbi:MAG: 3-deoxy-manno-octulosonate cytidylyltransferase [Bdellovibrionales bacterium]
MKTAVVIPARYASTRFPGKPLAKINGKEMILWTIEGVLKSKSVENVVVATDHDAIFDLVNSSPLATAVMTDSELPTGTDRVYQAIKGLDVDVVINVQGDEPLFDGRCLDPLLKAFDVDHIQMATMGRKFKAFDEIESQTTAKIVLNKNNEALYFSRFALPFSREKMDLDTSVKHIGIYAYRKSFLKEFCQSEPSSIEMAEGLEQLRALYLGAKIKVVMVESDSWGVDTPEDILKIENILAQRG